MPSERDWRRACIVLMGGKGWEEHYECGHGVPMKTICPERCAFNAVRRLLLGSA